MPVARVVLLLGVTLLLGAGIAAAETMRECSDARTEEWTVFRADVDRQRQACMGNRGCLAEAEARWQAGKKRIDDAAAACRARVRREQKPEPPPWANWKPGDPPPVGKDGKHYLMSCNGKVLGTYKPGGALEMELKTRGGSCLPSDNWGDPKLLPGPSDWGYCRDGSWGHRTNGCTYASPPPKN